MAKNVALVTSCAVTIAGGQFVASRRVSINVGNDTDGSKGIVSSCPPVNEIVNSTKEVIEMNMPGFTAEESLYNGNARYQATTEASFYGGIVQPASPFSDVISQDQDPPYLYRYPRWNCLKRVCGFHEYYPGFPVWECRWVHAIC